MPETCRQADPATALESLEALIEQMLAEESTSLDLRGDESADERDSVRNLAHHRALRRNDLRPLQRSLARLGLSSLGRAQAWTLGAVAATARAAGALAENTPVKALGREGIDLDRGRALLDARSDALFGPRPADRVVRVMVTMPDDDAFDDRLVLGCLDLGMNAARITTARGDADRWRESARRVRRLAASRGVRCRVFADLAGPKIRIDRIEKRGRNKNAARLRRGDAVLLVPSGSTTPAETGSLRLMLDVGGLGVRPSVGEQVWFDDGKVGAVVERAGSTELRLRITHAKPGGQRLRLGKGANFPDTTIRGPVLTARDHSAIDALASSVDGFIVSFVRGPEDIEEVRRVIAGLGDRGDPGSTAMIAKIETRAAFDHLYEILRELLRVPRAGVMIARGDLAVECGFERMAEIQTEILDCCEAAHLPVVWATEVLASLAKRGQASRAEITDAVFAQQAECVMLNKGPEILAALRTLVDILCRMQGHQRKKAQMLRPLAIAGAGRSPHAGNQGIKEKAPA